ncbi:MAG: DEAD/DEAH box helicase, partial [candidate division Zixibacteria bacterium]|nr:DEAD/DEAH box helicase [candidate division Zixibacteria bacterium]
PTRELAIQVDEAIQDIGRTINMHSVVLIGGASLSVQRNALKNRPQIIIATPGRLMDHIERRTVNLDNIEIFVLDEADRMLDMGFAPDIKKIMKSIPEKHQTMMFSATMPKAIEAMAEKLMENPTRIETDRSGATPIEVSHEMFFISNQDKKRLLAVQLKQCSGPVLVFTRTKRMASKLTTKVNSMGFTAAEIHSDRSLGQRRHALEGFKRGKYKILIATDIAARGIDVTGIEMVVNYDMPANSEDYVHRIGRTGRAGKTGHAVSYASADQKGSIRSIERFMKTKLAISALPTLPSEKVLLKEAGRLGVTDETAENERPSRRKSFRDRPSKRKGSQKGNFRKFAKKRTESEYSENKDRKRKNSKRKESKRKDSKAKSTQQSDFSLFDSTVEKSPWLSFKKKRSTKKKSVGQGTKRKKRAKRK